MHYPPIKILRKFSWKEARSLPIKDCGEPLIPISYCPERILARPQYYYQQIPASLPEVYLRAGVYKLLLQASELLPKGHRLVVYDGWRSLKLQRELFNSYLNELKKDNPDLEEKTLMERALTFVALPDDSPDMPPPHNTGGAVDLTIADERGLILPMGAEFDETSEKSMTLYFETLHGDGKKLSSDEELYLENRRLLFYVMTSVGFTNYPDEWWHYDFGNRNWGFMSGKDSAFYGRTKPFTRWN